MPYTTISVVHADSFVNTSFLSSDTTTTDTEKMKENTTYTTLLEKYLDGTTTTQEEELLLRELESRPADGLSSSERAILVMLGGAATARASFASEAMTSTPKLHPSRTKVWWLTIGSVAAAAMLTLLVKPWTGDNVSLPASEFGYQAGKQIESEDEAILLAEELLAGVVYDPIEEIEW